MWSLKTGGLLPQVIYCAKYTFGSLKGWSFNTGGLKNRFDCMSRIQALGLYSAVCTLNAEYYTDTVG